VAADTITLTYNDSEAVIALFAEIGEQTPRSFQKPGAGGMQLHMPAPVPQ